LQANQILRRLRVGETPRPQEREGTVKNPHYGICQNRARTENYILSGRKKREKTSFEPHEEPEILALKASSRWSSILRKGGFSKITKGTEHEEEKRGGGKAQKNVQYRTIFVRCAHFGGGEQTFENGSDPEINIFMAIQAFHGS
jgi:hypothetical protein